MIKVSFVLKQYTYCCLYCSPKKSEPQYAYKRYGYKAKRVYHFILNCLHCNG